MRLSAREEYRIAAHQAKYWTYVAMRDRDLLYGHDPYKMSREVRARKAAFAQNRARMHAADARRYAARWANEIRQERERS